jgi:peptide/nickel transport system substrate-binding protein
MAVRKDGEFSRREFLGVGLAGLGLIATGDSFATSADSSSAKGPKISLGPAATGTPVRGGTLRVGIITAGESETIDPMLALNIPDFVRTINLFDLMFKQESYGKVSPGLIESAEPNADATVWNFRVRDGVVWHDGKKLTADDIVWTIKNSWGNTANLQNAVLASIVDFAGVRKVGPRDVRVPLKVGVADFPTVTCSFNCLVVQEGTKPGSKTVGTGPFVLQSFTPGAKSVFTANRNYWQQGKPYVDRLVIDSSFSSEATRINALLSGQLDVVPGIPPSLAQAYANSRRMVIGNQPGPAFVGPVFRIDQDPFKDLKVRQALKLIPDRQVFVDSVFGGFASLGNDLCGATNEYWAADLKNPHDPEKAKFLLKQAGHENLTLTLETSAVVPGMNETATLYAQQAKLAGVNVKLKVNDPAVYFAPGQGVLTRPLSVTYFGAGTNSLASFYLVALVANGVYNESHWGSPEDNALLFKALSETNPEKATEKWRAVQQKQLNQGPYIIPANFNYVDGYSLKVRGVQTTPSANCDNFTFAGGWVVQ